MHPAFFLLFLGLSLGLLLLPIKIQKYYHFIIQLGVIVVTGSWAIPVWQYGATQQIAIPFEWWGGQPIFEIDNLSAFFLFLFHLQFLLGSLYTAGYLQAYQQTKSRAELGWHYFSLFWLHSSLVMVIMVQQALEFLVAWEIMSLSSVFLVLFYWEKKETVGIGLRYLIQMHLGMLFLLAGFLYVHVQTGLPAGFAALTQYGAEHTVLPVFLLFWVGFAFKAGFFPLHTWLPQAHTAAPSHVPAMTSGVMIKVGIYGILRIALPVSDSFGIGIFLLLSGLVTGLYGILNAIVQKDGKKILAYSSIENIGIIGIGLGISFLGRAWSILPMELLGLAGALLHIVNHALFKSLLFYTIGSVYQQTHTSYIEHLGGLAQRMPRTAALALIGVLGISGLPPMNGFVSEWLLYLSVLEGFPLAGSAGDLVLLLALLGITLIGGLSIFNFVRFYSIIFLGTARHECVSHAKEVRSEMLWTQYLVVALMLVIGLAGGWLLPYFLVLPQRLLGHSAVQLPGMEQFWGLSLAVSLLLVLVAILYFIRQRQQRSVSVRRDRPWGCGYDYRAQDVPMHQYTGTSFAESFHRLARPIVGEAQKPVLFSEDEIFPPPRQFTTQPYDKIEEHLVNRPMAKLAPHVEKAAIFQTGQLQHYVLYALLFLGLILVLSVLEII